MAYVHGLGARLDHAQAVLEGERAAEDERGVLAEGEAGGALDLVRVGVRVGVRVRANRLATRSSMIQSAWFQPAMTPGASSPLSVRSVTKASAASLVGPW